MKRLLPHNFVAKKQSEYFKNRQTSLEEDEIIIICDFAENYSFVVQDAIQSFHWSNDQCTIHPFCMYYKDIDGNLKCKSVIVIAESLKHDTVAVHLMQQKLINLIRSDFPTIKKLVFFSDGAASQYKNRKNFYNLCRFKGDYGYDVEWHFFATSHGKSACDALGGAFKRDAVRASLQHPGEPFITSARNLFEWAQSKRLSKTSFIFCTNEEYEGHARQQRTRYNNVRAIIGTQSYHSFTPINEKTIEAKTISDAENNDIHILVP